MEGAPPELEAMPVVDGDSRSGFAREDLDRGVAFSVLRLGTVSILGGCGSRRHAHLTAALAHVRFDRSPIFVWRSSVVVAGLRSVSSWRESRGWHPRLAR